jgi:effector-binding domain-containing protein
MKIAIILTIILLLILLGYATFNYFIMKDVKTPTYTVLKTFKNIESRHYAPMLVAEVTVSGKREEAASRGFKILADFIFGNNHTNHSSAEKIKMTAPVLKQPAQKIAMTAPVLQTKKQSEQWQIKFVMPQHYTLDSLPRPNNESIHIVQIPSKKMLAIRFSGSASINNLDKHQAELEQFIVAHHLKTLGEFEYAFYNPPWTLPAQRRNEILVEIE